MVPHERGQGRDVGLGEAHPRPDRRGHRLPRHAVVAGIALADVVQQRGDQQQVGPVDVAGELRRGGGGLDQVPVDGEPVPGVALRQGAHLVPLGQQPGEQPLLVELLEDGDGRAAAGQQPEEGPAHLGGPGLGHRRGVHGQHLERVRGEQQVGPRGGGRGAQQQARVRGGLRALGEHDLVALPDDALGERLAADPAVPAARTADEGRLHPPPRLVGDERQAAPGEADLAQQRVLVGQPQCGGHRPLLLPDQHVDPAAGAAAQLVPDVEQERVGLLHLGGGLVGELGGGRGAQHLPLAEAAVGLLEVGLEEEGELADLAGPSAPEVPQLGQQLGGGLAPAGESGGAQAGGEFGVAGDEARVEQAESRLDVGGRDGDRLRHRAHGVVQAQSGVPDRVPEGVGQGGDLGTTVVHQHQVEVPVGRGLTAAEAADGDQREALGAPPRRGAPPALARRRRPGHGVGQQAVQPLVQHRHPLGAGQPGQRLEIEHPSPSKEAIGKPTGRGSG